MRKRLMMLQAHQQYFSTKKIKLALKAIHYTQPVFFGFFTPKKSHQTSLSTDK
jgi:hypothetical protein